MQYLLALLELRKEQFSEHEVREFADYCCSNTAIFHSLMYCFKKVEKNYGKYQIQNELLNARQSFHYFKI